MKRLSLKNQAKIAPKYVLKVDGINLYLGDKQGLTGCNLVEDVSNAMLYSVGFDSEDMKIGIWDVCVQRQMNNKNINFKAIYL